MMTPFYLLLAALLPLLSPRLNVTGDTLRCSIGVSPGGRSATATILLAVGSSDTIHAGPGQVVPSNYAGHSGSGTPGPIYGQVFQITRFAGADSTALTRVFERRRDTRVVIVPWDYDAQCKPTRWTSGFAWVPVGEPGTFILKLRPDSLARFSRQAFDEWAVRWRTAVELEAPARFWLDRDDVLRVEQTTRLQDGRNLVVRGERIAMDVIACES